MTPNGMLLDLGGICKERKKKDTTNHLKVQKSNRKIVGKRKKSIP
jgi:hypothetical protein